MFDEYVLVERVPSKALVERHEGRPTEQQCVLRTHRAGVLQGSCDDEPSQALTLHAGCDGHPADTHHLCLGVADRDRQSQQAGVCHEPAFVSDAEVFFFRQPGQTVRGDAEGIVAFAKDLLLVRLRVLGSRTALGATENRFSDIPT